MGTTEKGKGRLCGDQGVAKKAKIEAEGLVLVSSQVGGGQLARKRWSFRVRFFLLPPNVQNCLTCVCVGNSYL
jgi:hypothetical protein